MVDITNIMLDTSQSGRRAGRQRQEHQAGGANTSSTNASDTASDTDATTNTNPLEGFPIPTIDSATAEAQAAWEEWLLQLTQVFYEYLVPLELNHDVEGRHRLINWLAENLGHDDALAQANPRTLQPEDRTAAHQNAAVTRVANRLSRAIQRLERLEERIPEDDEHWNRMIEMTRGLIPNEAPRRIPIYELDLATNEVREIQSYDGHGPARDGTNRGATNRGATNRGATNRRATNRRATNGVTTNGVTTNRVTTNGVATNRVTTNGVTTNGVTTNGVTTNGVATDEDDEIDI
ncbi:hypothetical protein V8C34DRAFT_301338 [Trichoderma compactum]